MRTKILRCLFFGAVLLATFSLGVIAKSPTPYADNFFNWWSEVPDQPGGGVISSLIKLNGSGGIKVKAFREPGSLLTHGGCQVYIDGSGITAPSVTAAKVDADFNASANCAYFVSRSSTCTLPSAVGLEGKEILVWNASPSGSVKYATTLDQTISGSAAGAVSNSAPYKLDRFMSDGSNWYRE